MQFLVIVRAIEPSPLPAEEQHELLVATHDELRHRRDPRILQVLSFAGERTFAMVVDVASGRELEHVVFHLPVEPLCSFEVHALVED